jgi:RND family efflux transporter MFP subunit
MSLANFGRTAATALFIVCLTSCGSKPGTSTEPLPVTIQVVHSKQDAGGNAYSGVIAADTQVDVAFKVNGYVRSIMQVRTADGQQRILQAGDRVKAGVVLASIKDDSYRHQVIKSTADLENARTAATKAKADFERYSQLYKEHVASRADYDAYKQQAESSRATVTAASASLGQAQVELADCQLKTPITGIILDRKIEVGTLVAVNSIGFQVGDTEKVKVVFGVPGAIVSSIANMAPITMTTNDLPGRVFQGSISKIGSAADPNSRLFDLEATIPNADGQLRVGMIATLNLAVGSLAKQMIVIPMHSIVRPPDNPDGYAVYVVESEGTAAIARLRPIVIGRVIGDDVSIASGLDEGSRVIVKGSDIVYDGEAVNVIP